MEMEGAGSVSSIRLEQSVCDVTACKFFAGQYFEGWGDGNDHTQTGCACGRDG